MLKRALIYGLVGLFFEVLWTGICSLVHGDFSLSSHTSLLMLPIYAAVVFMEPLFEKLREQNVSIAVRGVYYAAAIFACEYVSGVLLGILGVRPWLYSGTYSIDGVIRLDYAPLWFIAGIFYEEIYFLIRNGNKTLA